MGAVEVDQVVLVLPALGDDPVGLADDAILDREPLAGEGVGPALMPLADAPGAWNVTTNGTPAARLMSAATSADMKKFAWIRS